MNLYSTLVKPALFQFNAELVHNVITRVGEVSGPLLPTSHPPLVLKQEVAGLTFPGPLGLSAGFDYEARLTQTLSHLGFGFQTVGTITNQAYEGNSRPMLGRLPKSRSLMVNKGFKNEGAAAIIKKLTGKHFAIPLGISIGRSNVPSLTTQQASVKDIVQAFLQFEESAVEHSYYELNISCPNLRGSVEFYSQKNLSQLLTAVKSLGITRPIFVKMPIDKSTKETGEMLELIAKDSFTGVIFGNLQKNRSHPSLDPAEVARFPQGNFSGKPTYDDSNNLISFAYKEFKKDLVIIGCGGVFSAQDAYEKILRGASLVQLITGLIYEGPLLVRQINLELVKLLKRDGFKNLSAAVGQHTP